MPIDLESLRVAIGQSWKVLPTAELSKFSCGMLAAAYQGKPEPWLLDQLERYLDQQHARADRAACANIAALLIRSISATA